MPSPPGYLSIGDMASMLGRGVMPSMPYAQSGYASQPMYSIAGGAPMGAGGPTAYGGAYSGMAPVPAMPGMEGPLAAPDQGRPDETGSMPTYPSLPTMPLPTPYTGIPDQMYPSNGMPSGYAMPGMDPTSVVPSPPVSDSFGQASPYVGWTPPATPALQAPQAGFGGYRTPSYAAAANSDMGGGFGGFAGGLLGRGY